MGLVIRVLHLDKELFGYGVSSFYKLGSPETSSYGRKNDSNARFCIDSICSLRLLQKPLCQTEHAYSKIGRIIDIKIDTSPFSDRVARFNNIRK